MFCAAVFLFQRHQRTFKRAFEHSESLICNSANENSNVNPTHCGTSLKIFEREAMLSLLVCRISFQILSGIKDTYRRDGSTPLGVVWRIIGNVTPEVFFARACSVRRNAKAMLTSVTW